ncbi:DUF952 domain-containing protein [Gordonia hankookensis]|uniref:DUF952 domain-containing protein n=1 Tax=Gordonia hankookensis TaxID=589403 RepID=A0ABR7WGC1_9ACTN|nr:DUF952 domain-containing protein [Gordonia hankookensis]MBD1321817.1 DUF952 domain-containing protein [Gordonia hankookensis]
MTGPDEPHVAVDDDRPRLLVHLCTRDEWDTARHAGHREPPSLADAGFVHLSDPGQVHLPANRLFAGHDDLVLLVVDSTRLDAPVVWEPGMPDDPEGMRFPHLYGALPAHAVVEVRTYRPDGTGTFLPPSI